MGVGVGVGVGPYDRDDQVLVGTSSFLLTDDRFTGVVAEVY